MTNKELIKKLSSLKDLEVAGKPQDSWVSSSREILMSQIKPQATENFTTGDGQYYWQYFANMFKVALRPVGTFALVLITMLGYSATIGVANASLPGDMLYPIKTATEKVQLALTFEDDKKVQLQMGFVSRRVDELQQIVIKNEKPEEKVKKVSIAAKKISSDVKVVKEKLNQISNESTGSTKVDIVKVAKDVDTQTLQVGQTLVQANDKLSKDEKSEVSKDIHDAINSTEEAGTSALSVIVKKYEKGEAAMSDKEVATRVADRIKSTENNIAGAVVEVNQLITNVTNSTSSLATMKEILTANKNTTSTLANAASQPVAAQKIIEQAKDLLDQKNFSSAIDKIVESKDVVAQAVSTVQAITNTVQSKENDATVSTSTETLIKPLSPDQIVSTSTVKTSETTKSIVK